MHSRTIVGLMIFVVAAMANGCASYAPMDAADMAELRRADAALSDEQIEQATDASIQEMLDRQPLAGFPVNLALVRVQTPRYSPYTVRGRSVGQYRVITRRDVETDEALDRLRELPGMAGVAPMNALVIPQKLRGDEQLRAAAASVRANMVLVYTFDTEVEWISGTGFADMLTLGLARTRQAHITTTASAMLLDTRNGYVYGLAEASEEATARSNGWNRRSSVKDQRRELEGEAFEQLVEAFVVTWERVTHEHAGPAAASR